VTLVPGQLILTQSSEKYEKTNKQPSILIMIVLFFATSCTSAVVVKNDVPPGQMKKTTGSQSAKPYAPGQQKK